MQGGPTRPQPFACRPGDCLLEALATACLATVLPRQLTRQKNQTGTLAHWCKASLPGHGPLNILRAVAIWKHSRRQQTLIWGLPEVLHTAVAYCMPHVRLPSRHARGDIPGSLQLLQRTGNRDTTMEHNGHARPPPPLATTGSAV
jgi:hypothetical protein